VGDFRVDVASLRALSGRLRGAADELGAALGELSGASAGRLGAASLDEACQDFERQWQHGLSLIRDNVTKVGAGLDATAAAYQQHEQDLARLFTGVAATEGETGPFPTADHPPGTSMGRGSSSGTGPSPATAP
jgi:uncharacterized protein YukE